MKPTKFLRALLFILIISSKLIAQSGNENSGVLKGVVTYYFNSNYGYKPDVGSSVYVLSESKLNFIKNGINGSISWDTIAIFSRLKLCLLLKSLYAETGEQLSVGCDSLLNHFGITNNASEKVFFSRVFSNYFRFTDLNQDTKYVNVDGNGNYSIQLPEGIYYVIVKSSGRKGESIVEIEGKIITKRIEIKSGNDTILNAKFEVD